MVSIAKSQTERLKNLKQAKTLGEILLMMEMTLFSDR